MFGDNIHVFNANGMPANVTVSLAGAGPDVFTVPAGKETHVTFPAGNIGGPVAITSDQPVLAAQRVRTSRPSAKFRPPEVDVTEPRGARSTVCERPRRAKAGPFLAGDSCSARVVWIGTGGFQPAICSTGDVRAANFGAGGVQRASAGAGPVRPADRGAGGVRQPGGLVPSDRARGTTHWAWRGPARI